MIKYTLEEKEETPVRIFLENSRIFGGISIKAEKKMATA